MAVYGQAERHRFPDEEPDNYSAWAPNTWAFVTCEICSGDHRTADHKSVDDAVTPSREDVRDCGCGAHLSKYNSSDKCWPCEWRETLSKDEPSPN
jgi:hypothetical protein